LAAGIENAYEAECRRGDFVGTKAISRNAAGARMIKSRHNYPAMALPLSDD
jgi:hypothetical protein